MSKSISKTKKVSMLLRIGLVFVFLYAAVSSLIHPTVWEGFLPNFLTNNVSPSVLIKFFSIYELILVAWLISGRYIKYCAIVCTVTLVGIVLSNTGLLITTFRDVGLAFMAAALYFIED